MYAGNVGHVAVARPARRRGADRRADRDDVVYVINGGGSTLADVEARAAGFPNVVFVPMQPIERSIKHAPAAPVKNVDLSINQYNSALQPIGNLDLSKKDDGQKEAPEIKEESKLDPKEIMAKDDEFKTLLAYIVKTKCCKKSGT